MKPGKPGQCLRAEVDCPLWVICGRRRRRRNQSLVTRLYLDAPLAPANRETFYGGADQGYTDYPLLRGVEPHACYCDDAERAWG